MLRIIVATQLALTDLGQRSRRSDRAQSTAEYALIMLAVMAVVAAAVAFFTGSGKDMIGKIFSFVIEKVLGFG